jgi:hypothetical protein
VVLWFEEPVGLAFSIIGLAKRFFNVISTFDFLLIRLFLHKKALFGSVAMDNRQYVVGFEVLTAV